MPDTLNRQGDDIKKNQSHLDADLDVWVLLDQTRYMLFRARELELRQSGMTTVQAAVFRILQDSPKGVPLQDIPKLIMREPHSVSSLISRMANKGLVEKVRECKGKNIRIVITEKGRQLYRKSLNRTSLRMILSALSPEEQKNLALPLEKLRSRARQLLGMDYKPPFLSP